MLEVLVALVGEDGGAPAGLLRWMRLRARPESQKLRDGGRSITDIYCDLGVTRKQFMNRTDTLARRIVAHLNSQGIESEKASD